MPGENNPIIIILLAIIGLFVLTFLIVGLAVKISAFSREREYINTEIERTTGAAQRYWKQKKRRLWRMLLPFYRR